MQAVMSGTKKASRSAAGVACREDREDDSRRVGGAGVDAVRAGVDCVLVPGVDERLGVSLDVGALHDQQQSLTGLESGAGGEDLDLGLDDLPARDRECAAVGQDSQELSAELRVGLTV